MLAERWPKFYGRDMNSTALHDSYPRTATEASSRFPQGFRDISGGAPIPTPTKVGQVECALSELDTTLGAIERDIERLAGRLSPILRPIPSNGDAPEKNAECEARCAVADRIFSAAQRLRRLDLTVDTITGLIEL